MQNFHFTELGYLYPHEKITIDLATFEQVFVKDFPNSETRKTLFDNYLRYVDAFAKEITPNFTQWINGSFVTKKENPNDIDFVTFIDVDLYNKKEKSIEKYWTTETYDIGLDAWLVKIYTTENNLLQQYLDYRDEWYERFTHSREDIHGVCHLKGFLEIKYNTNGKETF